MGSDAAQGVIDPVDAGTADVVDDGFRTLDPRVVPLDRIVGAIPVAVLGGMGLVAVIIVLLAADRLGLAGRLALVALWVALVALLAWHAWRWPPRAWARTRYRVDAQGLEIQRGVYWREVVSVPRSRVQHTDVTQGPVERRFGLGTLVVFTAGTSHARVELPGLEHGDALRIRTALLPDSTSDAV